MNPLVAYRSIRSGRIPSAAKKITRSADGLFGGSSVPQAPSPAVETIMTATPIIAASQVILFILGPFLSGDGVSRSFPNPPTILKIAQVGQQVNSNSCLPLKENRIVRAHRCAKWKPSGDEGVED
jgi:hypothetical protein